MAKAQTNLRIPGSYASSIVREFRDLLVGQDDSLDLSAVEGPAAGGRTEVELLFALVEVLNDKVGSDWPVKASFAWRSQMHGTIDVAARSAPTLGDAVDVLGRFGHVRAPFAAIAQTSQHYARVLTMHPVVSIAEPIWRAIGEFILLSTIAILRQITDDRLTLTTIAMPQRPYAHRRLLEGALGLPIRFDGDEYVIRISQEACALALPFADDTLFKTTTDQLQAEAAQLSRHDWIVEDLRRYFEQHHEARPTASMAAVHLGLSQRSLVRKLAAHGTSFRVLLDDHLKHRALQLMEQGDLSHEEIAEQLGYSDRTSYARARRRWFGSADIKPAKPFRSG